MTLTIGQFLFLLRDAITALEASGELSAEGTFSDSPETIAKAVAMVMAQLENRGLSVPDHVKKAIAAAPMLLALAGV